MGYGRGLDADARKTAVVNTVRAASAGWTLHNPALPGTFRSVTVVTPGSTPALVDLATLSSDGLRSAHAARLVTQRSDWTRPDAVSTQRTLLGDARDLLVHVLRRRLGARLPPLDSTVERDALPWDDPAALFIHVGPTVRALALLRAVVAPEDDHRWNGTPEALDADGFVRVCARSGARATHLVLLGGSDYGTYFGVASFLEAYCGAAWLFPGSLGEVIPTATELRLEPAPDRLEEPTIRSRSHAQLSNVNTFTVVECDDIRSWALRNKLRPHEERAYIAMRVHQGDLVPHECQPRALSRTFLAALLETEERIPAGGHTLSKFLSPHLPTFAGAPDPRLRHRYMLEVYPDVRLRTNPPSYTIQAQASIRGRIHPVLGSQLPLRFHAVAVPCADTLPDSCCPVLRPFWPDFDPAGAGPNGVVVQEGATPHALTLRREDNPDRAAYVDANVSGGVFREGQFSAHIEQAYNLSGRTVMVWRFIPQTFRDRLEGVQIPYTRWHPCVFRTVDRLEEGRPAPVHDSLTQDLSRSSIAAMAGRLMRFGEMNHALTFEDGDVWCHCDACTHSDSYGGAGGEHVFYLGYYLTRAGGMLERSALRDRGTLQGSARASDVLAMPPGNGSWTAEPLHPFAHMTLDQLAVRGVIYHNGYRNQYTRRVLCLLNAVAGALGRAVTPGAAPPVIAFHAYVDMQAPPYRVNGGVADDTDRGLGSACHELLMPYITGIRDLHEYDDAFEAQTTSLLLGVEPGAFRRMEEIPDQFNFERWRVVARRTGMYEYLANTWYVTPNLYSRRLHNAIRRGARRFGLRGFVSEAQPTWSLNAPMLWELSRALWDPEGSPAANRDAFCRHAFGAAAAPMRDYLDTCEAAAAATRDHWPIYRPGNMAPLLVPDRRMRGSATAGYFGDGFVGRAGFLSTFDGWYELVPSGGAQVTRLRHAWRRLNDALRSVPPASPERERVGLFRRAFGLTLLVGLWYEPLQRAFDLVRRANPTIPAMQQVQSINPGLVRDQTGADGQRSVAAVYVAAQKPTLPADLLSRVQRVLGAGPFNRPGGGVRRLRNDVHAYLALTNAGGSVSVFQEMQAELGDVSEVGLGLYPGLTTMADDAIFPLGPVPGPLRALGPYLPELERYILWWFNINRRDDGTQRSEREILNNIRETDAHGFGWVFTAYKHMASAIALYCEGMADASERTVNSLLTRILQG